MVEVDDVFSDKNWIGKYCLIVWGTIFGALLSAFYSYYALIAFWGASPDTAVAGFLGIIGSLFIIFLCMCVAIASVFAAAIAIGIVIIVIYVIFASIIGILMCEWPIYCLNTFPCLRKKRFGY